MEGMKQHCTWDLDLQMQDGWLDELNSEYVMTQETQRYWKRAQACL